MVEKKVNPKIRELDSQAIRANIDKLKEELRTLRNAKASSGSATKLAKIKGVRKNIARNLTALNRKERDRVAGNLHKSSGKRAIYLRTKLTRAVRRELSKYQKSKRIVKVVKKESNFPLRRYGLKAWLASYLNLNLFFVMSCRQSGWSCGQLIALGDGRRRRSIQSMLDLSDLFCWCCLWYQKWLSESF